MTEPKPRVARQCAECGVEFLVPDGSRKLCCGPECARERHLRKQREFARKNFVPSTHRESLLERECKHCGKAFKPYTVKNVFCSKRCQSQHTDAHREFKQVKRFCRKCGLVQMHDRRQLCDDCRVENRPVDALRQKERRRTIKKYGITVEQFDAMLTEQGECCAICRSPHPGPKTWHIDHDHNCCPPGGSCGKCVRGLLCHSCNLLIGYAESSGFPIMLLYSAIGYLTANGTPSEAAWDGQSLRQPS